jgi:hypothetical protein
MLKLSILLVVATSSIAVAALPPSKLDSLSRLPLVQTPPTAPPTCPIPVGRATLDHSTLPTVCIPGIRDVTTLELHWETATPVRKERPNPFRIVWPRP